MPGAALKLGIYLNAQHPEGDDPGRRFAETVEPVRLIRSLGFDDHARDPTAPRVLDSAPHEATAPARPTAPVTSVLILPGYADSGSDHWQSHWERDDPACRRVVQDDWLQPRLGDWLATLDRHVRACATPPVLAAHSLACALVAHWAAGAGAAVKGALLVAPADVDSPAHTPDEVRGFSPIPLVRLPFPSIVVASADDAFVDAARAAAFARAWGSRLVTLPAAGHINADAGFGPWPEGRRLLAELTSGRAAA